MTELCRMIYSLLYGAESLEIIIYIIQNLYQHIKSCRSRRKYFLKLNGICFEKCPVKQLFSLEPLKTPVYFDTSSSTLKWCTAHFPQFETILKLLFKKQPKNISQLIIWQKRQGTKYRQQMYRQINCGTRYITANKEENKQLVGDILAKDCVDISGRNW